MLIDKIKRIISLLATKDEQDIRTAQNDTDANIETEAQGYFGVNGDGFHVVKAVGSLTAPTRSLYDSSGILYYMGSGSPVALVSASVNYKSYVALVTQTSTSAPTVTELENTVGTVTWARGSTGTYTCTKTGIFTSGKVAIPRGITNHVDSAGVVYNLARTSNNVLTLTTKDAGSLADGKLSAFLIEFKIYA